MPDAKRIYPCSFEQVHSCSLLGYNCFRYDGYRRPNLLHYTITCEVYQCAKCTLLMRLAFVCTRVIASGGWAK